VAHCNRFFISQFVRNGDCVAKIEILGVEFYPVTLDGAMQAVDWMLSRNDGRTRLVVTGNPLMTIAAQKDPEFMSILKSADLMVPDGVGILWAAQKLGKKLPERVDGVSLVYRILEMRPSPRVFLLGGKPGVPEKARSAVEKERPGVRFCGTHHGYFQADEEDKVVEAIADRKSDIILVGMGSPKQEKFIWRNRARLGAKVALGVGGVLDILSGKTQRAPESFQKAGLEWLFRLVREPKRLKADLALLEFVARVEAQAFRQRKTKHEGDEEDAAGKF
jgi:N-acetylglucosaminyldiphosphoundecaprenol N-acetyl-beta-D-mannosaminyltransferase